MSATIREYHQRTKHSVASVRKSRHFLDWDNQPLPFKIYTALDPIPLPAAVPAGNVPALPAIASAAAAGAGLDLRALARVLHYSAGVTRTKTYPGGQTMRFRAAACTGALYHIDLYLICGGEIGGLTPGVYHFGPHDNALRRLRSGDHRRALLDASGGAAELERGAAALVLTSTFWRNAWKYQARAYRHCFWDSGTILANLLAVAAADGVAARLVVGFDDAAVNRLLDVDPNREVALAIVALGSGTADLPPAPPAPPLGLATQPLSAREVDYPLIRAAHTTTSLADGAAARDWRARAEKLQSTPATSASAQPTVELRRLETPPATSIEDAIVKRGSARRFSRAAIEFAALSEMLRAAIRPLPADCNRAGEVPLVEPYLIVNAVDGLTPGAYHFDAAAGALACLRPGDFRREAGFLDLGQELAADAAVNVYLLADLDRILAALGERGYRAAQLEGAVIGGRLYLAAYALGLGATGLTFFDDEVTAFFSPHAARKAVMFLVAIGRRARRPA